MGVPDISYISCRLGPLGVESKNLHFDSEVLISGLDVGDGNWPMNSNRIDLSGAKK